MKNLHSSLFVQKQSYFKGWFIALHNYEVFEIEAVKKKITVPLNGTGNSKLPGEIAYLKIS